MVLGKYLVLKDHIIALVNDFEWETVYFDSGPFTFEIVNPWSLVDCVCYNPKPKLAFHISDYPNDANYRLPISTNQKAVRLLPDLMSKNLMELHLCHIDKKLFSWSWWKSHREYHSSNLKNLIGASRLCRWEGKNFSISHSDSNPMKNFRKIHSVEHAEKVGSVVKGYEMFSKYDISKVSFILDGWK